MKGASYVSQHGPIGRQTTRFRRSMDVGGSGVARLSGRAGRDGTVPHAVTRVAPSKERKRGERWRRSWVICFGCPDETHQDATMGQSINSGGRGAG